MNQPDLKTLVPAIVGAGILVYEAYTGHQVSNNLQGQIVNGVLSVVGFGFTIFGIIKNHSKGA